MREPVQSSSIQSIGYDPDGQVLEVVFKAHPLKGAVVWEYRDVAPQEHYELVTAESIGRAFNFIRASKPARKIATIDSDGVEHAIEEVAHAE